MADFNPNYGPRGGIEYEPKMQYYAALSEQKTAEQIAETQRVAGLAGINTGFSLSESWPIWLLLFALILLIVFVVKSLL